MEPAQAVQGEPADMAVGALVSLEAQSLELGRVALMGRTDRQPEPAASTLHLLKKLENLKQQKFELENRIRAEDISTDDFPPEIFTTEYLTQTIESLKTDIDDLRVTHHNRSLLLRRLQMYDVVKSKAFERGAESQMICDTMEHSRRLCSRILALQKETCTLEEQLIDVRKRRMHLRATCTTLMTKLRDLKEKEKNNFALMGNPEFREINEYIKKEANIVTVVQNIFQRLLLSSGVNWAEDPRLKEIVLKLGKNPACS
ncbi:centromere protein H [Anomaloglossus baeobatrachus]|uniref:centromere protein H n=1 Tax=Anomaloglossus baeobatrachus TaxID=238106 RepID=UPI003F50759A